MFAEERRIRICEMLNEKNTVQLGELAALFQTSTETIRRDLLDLERKGCLQRIHGGAISVSRMVRVKELSQRISEFQDRKRELSGYAAEMIQEGDTIAVDSGSTAIAFIREVAGRFGNLTVVTHSLDVTEILRNFPDIQTILCGGRYLPAENAFYGDFTLDMLNRLHVDKAFLFPSAISVRGGIMDYNYELLQIQRNYLKISDRIFFLADSSKFEKSARLKLDDLHPEYTVVTDSFLSDEVFSFYEENNVKIIRGKEQIPT